MALKLYTPVHMQHICLFAEGFQKVLCMKVTIPFITDVVYIFDMLMFILFCEEERRFRRRKKTHKLVCVCIGIAQGLIFAL